MEQSKVDSLPIVSMRPVNIVITVIGNLEVFELFVLLSSLLQSCAYGVAKNGQEATTLVAPSLLFHK